MLLSLCLLYVSLRPRVSPSILFLLCHVIIAFGLVEFCIQGPKSQILESFIIVYPLVNHPSQVNYIHGIMVFV